MIKSHKKVLSLGNHMRNLVGQPYYEKKPTKSAVLEELLNGMANMGNGTVWNPVATVENGKSTSTDLMLLQCPGACGRVWKINIKDKDCAAWLVNEINQRRHGKSQPTPCPRRT